MFSMRFVAVLLAGVLAADLSRQAPPAPASVFNVIGYYAEWTNGRYPL